MRLDIVLPYAGAAEMARIWAFQEAQIDFEREPEKAERCTLSFAAVELMSHLQRSLKNGQVRITAEKDGGCFSVCLKINREIARSSYILRPCENGLMIEGGDRTGVLYGAYELLKLQGWRWYEPNDMGEIAPEPQEMLTLPSGTAEYRTVSELGRGFTIEGRMKESSGLLLWMARNRLNMGGQRQNTMPLMCKLGITKRNGGHIFEALLDPDRPEPSGKTLWEAHPEWYGMPASGKKQRETALQTQFCVTRPDLMAFLSEELLERIMGEWKGADEIDVWGLDTWGSVCSCPSCRALGNGTDQNLYMASQFRTFLNRARTEGRLDRDIKLVLCSYEGTSTLLPPEKPVPQNLIDAGDYILYAPIVRCYAHTLEDAGCSYNRFYQNALSGWSKVQPCIGLVALEYYNVGKFEDLPLLFSKTMQRDFQNYVRNGVRGFSYMHVPLVNWGMRALTQLLFAELSWDPNADVEQMVRDYLQNRYAQYAAEMAEVYQKTENAWRFITSWRDWKDKSFLYQMLNWDGRQPDKPLQVDDHFETPAKLEQMGRASEELLSEALEQLSRILRREKNNTAHISDKTGSAVNPIEQRRLQQHAQLRYFLSEDKRLLIYGRDTLRLMLRMGQYYNALYEQRLPEAADIWEQIESLEEQLESYYLPLRFDELDIVSSDALLRTQLRDTIARCRKYRIEALRETGKA